MPAFAQSTFTALFSGTGIESAVDDIVKDIEASWKEIIYMCLVALGKYPDKIFMKRSIPTVCFALMGINLLT